MSEMDRAARVEFYRAESQRADDLAGSDRKDEALAILNANRATAAEHGDEDYAALFDAEILHYSGPDYSRQIERLKQGLRWAEEKGLPADFLLLRTLGIYHSFKDDEDAAIEWCDKALAENPKDGKAMLQRGASLSKKGDQDGAIEWNNKALAEDPKDFDAMRNKGVSLSKKGDQDGAIKWFDKALAENPKDSMSHRCWAVSELNRSNPQEALARMRQAVELDSDRWAGDFRAICKFAGVDADAEWEKLFPEGTSEQEGEPDRPKQEDVLEELPTLIEFLRNAFRKEAKEYLKKQEDEEKRRQGFIEPHSRLDPERSLLMVLRRWNSYTPALPSEDDERVLGGGYFLWHNGHGTVIDPGYDFLDNFDRARCRICDIDNVILTHAHNDHTIDFESLRALLHEFNDKAKDEARDEEHRQKKVRFFLNNGAFMKFSGLLDLKDNDFTDRVTTMNPGAEFDLLGGGKFQVLPAYHDEVLARDQATGVLVTLPTAAGDRRILFTGDTGLFPLKRESRRPEADARDPSKEVWRQYPQADGEQLHALIVHIGAIKRTELSADTSRDPAFACYPNHLGLIGTARVITQCQPKLAVVSEFGEEMKGFRTKLVKGLQDKVLEPALRDRVSGLLPRAVPGDLALIYDLAAEQFYSCVSRGWRDVAEIDFADGDKDDSEGVYYFAKDEREAYDNEPGRWADSFRSDRKNRRGMYFRDDAD